MSSDKFFVPQLDAGLRESAWFNGSTAESPSKPSDHGGRQKGEETAVSVDQVQTANILDREAQGKREGIWMVVLPVLAIVGSIGAYTLVEIITDGIFGDQKDRVNNKKDGDPK